MQEEWRVIPEFPRYGVSNLGLVEFIKTNHILKPTVTAAGHLKVNLSTGDKLVRTRQVNQLVAAAYLDAPFREDCTSLIHLDGNKRNCRADNLDWRPRYFALAYHAQFRDPLFQTAHVPVIEVKTQTVYETAQQAAVQHGLIFREILRTSEERTFVWPTYQQFRILSD